MQLLLFNIYPAPDQNGRIPLGGEKLARLDQRTVKINTASVWWVVGCALFCLVGALLAYLLTPVRGDLRPMFAIAGFLAAVWACCGLFSAVVAADYRGHVRQGGRIKHADPPWGHLLEKC